MATASGVLGPSPSQVMTPPPADLKYSLSRNPEELGWGLLFSGTRDGLAVLWSQPKADRGGACHHIPRGLQGDLAPPSCLHPEGSVPTAPSALALLRVAEKEAVNKMSLHNLATVFGPTLLRPSEKESKLPANPSQPISMTDSWSLEVMSQVRGDRPQPTVPSFTEAASAYPTLVPASCSPQREGLARAMWRGRRGGRFPLHLTGLSGPTSPGSPSQAPRCC